MADKPSVLNPHIEKHQDFEILLRLGYEFKVLINHNHPLEPDLLNPRVSTSHGGDPGVEIRTPAIRNKIEVGKVRLPFKLNRSHLRKPLNHHSRLMCSSSQQNPSSYTTSRSHTKICTPKRSSSRLNQTI